MIRIVNARNVTGEYFGFEIEGDRFLTVTKQAGPMSPGANDSWRPLESLTVLNGQGSPLSGAKGAFFRDINKAGGSGHAVTEGVFDAAGATILPAGLDVHVHSRSPGLTHKEDWHTLAKGAYRGGVSGVADMPNTIPPMMTREAVVEKAAIARQSGLDFRLFLGVGASNIDKVADILGDPALPLCGLKVFYGRTTGDLMYDDLETLARSLPADGSKIIVFHSEDQCGVDRNHACHAADLDRLDHKAFAIHSVIRSSETAHASTRTILHWAKTSYKRPIHIAHVSTPLEVEMIAECKAQGMKVTCEVAPHHLLLSTADYERLGPLGKMNPPLRSPEEVAHLQRLVSQGLVDIFATDHAPHLMSEKLTTVGKSPSGVPSLEFYYPLIFEVARITGLDLSLAVSMSSELPAKLFGFEDRGRIASGCKADFVWMGDHPFVVKNQDVVSRCGWSPYDGWTLPRDVRATWVDGELRYVGPS